MVATLLQLGRGEHGHVGALCAHGLPFAEPDAPHKQGNGQREHNVIMLALASVVGFIRGFGDLDPEVPEFFLEGCGMGEFRPNAQAAGLQESLHGAHQQNLGDVVLAARFPMPPGSAGNRDPNRPPYFIDEHVEHRSSHARVVDRKQAIPG